MYRIILGYICYVLFLVDVISSMFADNEAQEQNRLLWGLILLVSSFFNFWQAQQNWERNTLSDRLDDLEKKEGKQ